MTTSVKYLEFLTNLSCGETIRDGGFGLNFIKAKEGNVYFRDCTGKVVFMPFDSFQKEFEKYTKD